MHDFQEGELVEAEAGGVAHERVQAAGGVHVEVGVAGDVGAVACRGRAVDEEVAVRQDVALERDDGARVAGAVAEDARSASTAQPAGALASATVGDARAWPYDDASADASVMLGQLYHLIEAGDLPAAGRRNELAPPYRGESGFLGHRRRDRRAVPLTVPCKAITVPCSHDGPTQDRRRQRLRFSRACSSVIDAASSRWPISHIRRASTATTTMTTNPITSSSTATVGLCSSSDQCSPFLPRL